jgi:hypothetical protein
MQRPLKGIARSPGRTQLRDTPEFPDRAISLIFVSMSLSSLTAAEGFCSAT